MTKKTMRDYIEEATSTMQENLNNYETLVDSLVELFNKNCKTLWFVASGSSYNACLCAYPVLKNCLAQSVKIVTPFNFIHYDHEMDDDDIVIVISQSGLSTNAIEAVKYLSSLQIESIVLTGNKDSDIKKYATHIIEYGVGEELVGYVTKGVSTLALFLMLFAIKLTNRSNLLNELQKAIHGYEEVKDKSEAFIRKHYLSFSSMKQCYLLGCGPSSGVAMEGTLKMSELIHIPCNCFEYEEYIHGPNFQLTPAYTTIIFDNQDDTSKRVFLTYEATSSVSKHTFMLSNNDQFKNDDRILYINCKVMPMFISLVYLPFIQTLSFIISEELNVKKQHPLMKKFNDLIDAKTENYVNYDEDL